MPLLRSLLFVSLLPVTILAAELEVLVRTAAGRPVPNAVVYAVPEGRRLPLAQRRAVMDQKNRMFIPHVLPVQVGTAVSFPNSDDIHHQVYSFSPPKRFQLPLYKGTPGDAIVFDKPGVVALGCNIHDNMSAYIVVVETPHFRLVESGRAQLRDLDAGAWNVRVWYPELRGSPLEQRVILRSGERRELAFEIGRR